MLIIDAHSRFMEVSCETQNNGFTKESDVFNKTHPDKV